MTCIKKGELKRNPPTTLRILYCLQQFLCLVETTAKEFQRNFNKTILNDKRTELENLNDEIKASGNQDVKKLKEQSASYQKKLREFTEELIKEKARKEVLISEKKINDDKINSSKVNNAKVNKLITFDNITKQIKAYLEKFCDEREKEKKSQLEIALNEIFNRFYDNQNGITLSLDQDYCLIIKDKEGNIKETFASGGQEVVLALAFIGAVVKLNGEKSKDASQSEADNKEIYPLVMDAPVSNFGEKQYQSLCDNMPSLTNQMIIFVNDIGAAKLREKISSQIGESYKIRQKGPWESEIVKEV